jgi:2-amino-4-hydroxy-6-hydroxymethyldihydropteridine diphosphokinase
VRLLGRSSDYETPPWGVTDQPAFVNLALRVETELGARDLPQAGAGGGGGPRPRPGDRPRWGPRPVDIDILAYDDIRLDEPDLHIPHPRMTERAFVLVPLAEIAPDWVLEGRTIAEWAAAIDTAGVTRLPG